MPVILFESDEMRAIDWVFVHTLANSPKISNLRIWCFVLAGGSAIQDECKKHISVQGTLLVGRVFASKAGKLPVKAILHTVSPKWKEGKSKETEYLKDAVDNTLKEALSKKFESIAMPAISTGGSFGFQPASATSAIVEGIAEFFTDFKGQCCLKSIELVDSSDQASRYYVEWSSLNACIEAHNNHL